MSGRKSSTIFFYFFFFFFVFFFFLFFFCWCFFFFFFSTEGKLRRDDCLGFYPSSRFKSRIGGRPLSAGRLLLGWKE